ncbi:uncharacterized protein [Rutidosis leptorrhynchoides]|uniref:uncharacterized protein n=1 Tax=Rutidosis leptorrhynchoides TaxID=125765 RepID=UPI003A99F24D
MGIDTFFAIRQDYGIEKLMELYADCPSKFTVKLHYGGLFTKPPNIEYLNGKVCLFDGVDSVDFGVESLVEELEWLGYHRSSRYKFHFQLPESDMDNGLHSFANDDDVKLLTSYVGTHKEISMFVEYEDVVDDSSQVSCLDQFYSQFPSVIHDSKSLLKNTHDKVVCDIEVSSDDEVYIVDEDNKFEDEDEDMSDFNFSIDKDVDFMGNASQAVTEYEPPNNSLTIVEDLDNDDFDSDYEGVDADKKIRKKKINEAKMVLKDNEEVGNTYFYVGQEFGSREEVKELVRMHAVETRRQLVFIKNEKLRLQVGCQGECDEEKVLEKAKRVVEKGKKVKDKGKKPVHGEAKKKTWRKVNVVCDWNLYVSKTPNMETWIVKTFKPIHVCHQSRNIKHCTYEFLASKLVNQIPTNPKIPTAAIKSQYEQEFHMDISKYKAYRALQAAKKVVEGDYAKQYDYLRDYLEELSRSNPGTTVRLLTEPCDDDVEKRRFFRCYVCLGPLKEGFRTLSRDLLGLDGAFMKEPATGQILFY